MGLFIPRSSVRFRQKLQKSRTWIYMDLRYIDPQARVLNYCYKYQRLSSISRLTKYTISKDLYVCVEYPMIHDIGVLDPRIPIYRCARHNSSYTLILEFSTPISCIIGYAKYKNQCITAVVSSRACEPLHHVALLSRVVSCWMPMLLCHTSHVTLTDSIPATPYHSLYHTVNPKSINDLMQRNTTKNKLY